MIRDDEVVGINLVRQFGDAFEDIGAGNPLQLECRFILFVNGLNLNFFGIRQQRADDDA